MQTVWALLPGLISFFLGSVYQSYRAARSEGVAQINELLSEVRSVQDLGSEYWTSDKAKSDTINEVKIRGSCFLIAQYVSQAETLLRHRQSELEKKTDDLIDLLTGGKFETAAREAQFDRAIQIRIVAAEIVLLCRSARLELVAVSAIFHDIVRPPLRSLRQLHSRYRLF